MDKTVDVIIPVYRPDERFRKNLVRLSRQTYSINKIILMNTEEKFWNPELIKGFSNVELYHLKKQEFDHGGTRKCAAALSKSDIMVFMTQDAMPHKPDLIEKLVEKFWTDGVKAVYARQLPAGDCDILERRTRAYNYPGTSLVKSREDLPRMGIRTYFCSNVCAAYDKGAYGELGGFVAKTIFNEDMIYAAEVIRAGYRIYYAADACVIHSHNYNCRQQFHRNFDLGVSQAKHPEIFNGIPSEGEGIRLVKETAKYVCAVGRPDLLIALFFRSAFKYLGYFLGKHYAKLPRSIILWCTMNREYWK